MEQLLKDFTELGIQLYNNDGEMKNTRDIIEEIVKTAQGFDKVVLIQKLNEYINLKERA